MIVGDQKAILLPLINEFSEVRSEDPDQMRLRMQALIFCLLAGFLFNQDPGFGDLRLCPMVRQMEDMGCIGGIVLAETIRRLDRAALGFDDWTADADDDVGTDEEIVLAPRTGEVGESSAARDDSEDVAPRRRRDT
ncbi:hypothetical protein JCGZ_12845 [Jatropha curcas]|uniref:Uncharacterized protein n=1 Tax=Jatropha curcas TaxID=180498 RepID=A0A067KDJ6_JATCU|nr:hypothetical protein JCGZ_12845 [Jatropha curcas]